MIGMACIESELTEVGTPVEVALSRRPHGAGARRPVPDLRPGEDATAGLTPDRPVGILAEDGHGISVARALQRLLPREDLLLLCDDAYAPYARRRPAVVAARVASLLAELRADGAKLIVIASPQAVLDALAAQPAGAVALIRLEAPIPQAGAACGGGAVAAVVVDGSVRPRTFGQALRRQRGASAIHLEQWPLDDADAVEARTAGADRGRRRRAGADVARALAPASCDRARDRRRVAGRRGRRSCRPAGAAHAAARGSAGAPAPTRPPDRHLDQSVARCRAAQGLASRTNSSHTRGPGPGGAWMRAVGLMPASANMRTSSGSVGQNECGAVPLIGSS